MKEKDYNNLGLMQLRLYARKIGVKSPTALQKNKLIEKILEIENGKAFPTFSRRGRPPKINTNTKNELIYKEALANKIKEVRELTNEYLKNLSRILND